MPDYRSGFDRRRRVVSSSRPRRRAFARALVCSVFLLGLQGCSDEGTLEAGSGVVEPLTRSNCPAGTRILEGTNRADFLVGTSGDDCILGYNGNDIIIGRRGDDYLVGGRGKDVIFAGPGDDTVFGEKDKDLIVGGSGHDAIRGGSGNDFLLGNAGDDEIRGGKGDDILCGGRGNDYLRGGAGDDLLKGEQGDDLLDGGPGDDRILGGPGDDTVVDGLGEVLVEANVNTAPVVESIVPSPTRVDTGETTQLTTIVVDPDGDALAFAWSSECEGTFSATDASSPSFTLGAAAAELCTLVLEVSDGRGGLGAGYITIETGAAR